MSNILKKNRIGILIDNITIPNWIYTLVKDLQSSEHSQVVLIIIQSNKTLTQPFWEVVFNNFRLIFWRIFSWLDYIYYKCSSDALANKRMSDFRSIELVDIETINHNLLGKSHDKDIVKTNGYEIDVLLHFGFRELSGKILDIPKYGIWTSHIIPEKSFSKGYEGVWEVIYNHDETYVGLEMLNSDLKFMGILSQSFSRTDSISISRNRNNYYWKYIQLIKRKLNEIYLYGANAVCADNLIQNINTSTNNTCRSKIPSNWILLKKLLFLYLSRALNKFDDLFYFDQWILLFKFSDPFHIPSSFSDYRKIIPPKDRFWADPFIIERNDKYYIFIEEVIFKNIKGHISVIEMDQEGNFSKPEKVIERDYHLSYPFLIEDNGFLYMIPETSENNQIELYKCIDFPLKWELRCVLMENVRAVDTTIYQQNNKYWLFTNIKENDGISNSDELFLFQSDELISQQWIEHKRNPIISNVQNSRPAGNLFNYNGKLYRPSQDCLKRYGYGFNLADVTKLDEGNFKEILYESYYSNWDRKLVCTHTFNSYNKLNIIDAVLRRWRY
jgi:hypothetical protein